MGINEDSSQKKDKKKWSEYALDFFMLFLAVYLGFLAENIRDDIQERHRESDYIQSIVNDLKTDTAELGQNIAKFQRYLPMQDTVMAMLSTLNNGFNRVLYRNFESLGAFPGFIYTDATIMQLKYSGGFILIKNHEIIDSIMGYDAIVKKELISENHLLDSWNKMQEYYSEVFNLQRFGEQDSKGKSIEQMDIEKTDVLLTHDKFIVPKFFTKISRYRFGSEEVRNNMVLVKSSGTNLIRFLKLAYHLN